MIATISDSTNMIKQLTNGGDYVHMDNIVIIAVPNEDASAGLSTAVSNILVAALGPVVDNNECITTTTTTTAP